MLIAHSTSSCAMAYKGNRVRETLRSSCQMHGKSGRPPHDGKSASFREIELDSASLHVELAVKLPDVLKPVIDKEAMSGSTYRANRGDWRRRAQKEYMRTPGDPFQRVNERKSETQGISGNHNRYNPWQRESDWLIVVKKWSNVHGAKGPNFSQVFIEERRTA
jgi:hypothetical protein